MRSSPMNKTSARFALKRNKLGSKGGQLATDRAALHERFERLLGSIRETAFKQSTSKKPHAEHFQFQ